MGIDSEICGDEVERFVVMSGPKYKQ